MPFYQDAPTLGNQYHDDPLLRQILSQRLGAEVLEGFSHELTRMGALAAGEMAELGLKYRSEEPEHVPFDAWGHRVDHVTQGRAWDRYREIAAEAGLVALPYEDRTSGTARLRQMALVYLFAPSSQVYTCPLAMTDGCAMTLSSLSGQHPAAARASDEILPRLTARASDDAWLAGQWMTERTGGSDVGRSETTAVLGPDGWRLSGTKWFTSAISADVALTLGRPEGAPAGGKGLALFMVRLRDSAGNLSGITVNRLKEKLGTRHVPTAELELVDTPATLIAENHSGIRNMAYMLNVTRLWNAVCSVASMRRGLALAEGYSNQRVAFGAPLSQKPLHQETLSDLRAEWAGAMHLVFHAVGQMDALSVGALDQEGAAGVRALVALCKLVTGKLAVRHASEALECFGGAGYVEDTGLPELLRDAQVLPIWEGTTNVLSLELCRGFERAGGIHSIGQLIDTALGEDTSAAADWARRAKKTSLGWFHEAEGADREAGARRFAVTLGYALMVALTLEHGRSAEGDGTTCVAFAKRIARLAPTWALD